MATRIHNKDKRPILAILTMSDDQKLFRGNRANFLDIIKQGKRMNTLVYVTTTENLQKAGETVKGYIYQDKRWMAKEFPRPEVIYNRIPNRKDENQAEVQHLLGWLLKHSQIQIFNPSFFTKSELIRWVGQSELTKSHIPATRLLQTKKDLEQLLGQYSSLYLKPTKGKAGKGIMRITKNKITPIYTLVTQHGVGSSKTHYPSIDELWKNLSKKIGQQEYIAQQAIHLARFHNRPYDLRVLIQKDGTGSWNVTGIGARLAGERSITTHVPRGGSIEDPSELLLSSFGRKRAQDIWNQTKLFALRTAKVIEEQKNYSLGEMSMDIGIDEEGKIWFFEANAKPMKFDEPQIRSRSLQNLLEYSIYLSRLSMNNREVPTREN